MTEAEKQLKKVNEKRALLKPALEPVEVGYNYAKAIGMLHEHGYTYQEIADRIGASRSFVCDELCNGSTPNHITGELIAGMLKDEYDPEGKLSWKEVLPLADAQKDGGRVTTSRKGEHKIK
jgi:hypothetical protein